MQSQPKFKTQPIPVMQLMSQVSKFQGKRKDEAINDLKQQIQNDKLNKVSFRCVL